MKRDGYLWHMCLSMGTRLVMIALRLLRNILLARLLGPAERGLFSLLSALPELIGAVASGGLNSAVAYKAARQPDMGLLVTYVLIYGCALATLLTLAGLIILQLSDMSLEVLQQLGLLVWLLLLAVPLTIGKNALLTLHNAGGGVGQFNGMRLLESLLPLLLFVGLWVLFPQSVLEAAVGSWLAALLIVVVIGWCWLGRFHRLRLRWRTDSQKELFRYGVRSHPDVLFQQILLRADYLLIGVMLPAADLGYYVMASAAAELLLIIPEAVTTPLMKRLLQQGAGIERLTPLALRLTASVMLLACLSLGLIGEWLIVSLFGVAYAPAYPALLFLLPGLFGLCYTSILRLDLLGKQRPGALSLMMGVGALFNVLLNLWLIPHAGIVGAAIAYSAACLLVTLAMLRLYCRLGGVAWWRTLLLLPEDISLLLALLRERKP